MLLLNKFIKNYIQLNTEILYEPVWECNKYSVLGKKIFGYFEFDTSDLFCIDRRASTFNFYHVKNNDKHGNNDKHSNNDFNYCNKYISIGLFQCNEWIDIYCFIKDDNFNVNINGVPCATNGIKYRFDGYITKNSFEWPIVITLPQFIEQYGIAYHDKNLSILNEDANERT